MAALEEHRAVVARRWCARRWGSTPTRYCTLRVLARSVWCGGDKKSSSSSCK